MIDDGKFTDKDPAILDLMESVAGRRREAGHCVMEDGTSTTHDFDFRDQLSRQEYRISGLCQTCQDSVFGIEEEEGEEETLGPCGCSDYHYADCPLRQSDYTPDYDTRWQEGYDD